MKNRANVETLALVALCIFYQQRMTLLSSMKSDRLLIFECFCVIKTM